MWGRLHVENESWRFEAVVRGGLDCFLVTLWRIRPSYRACGGSAAAVVALVRTSRSSPSSGSASWWARSFSGAPYFAFLRILGLAAASATGLSKLVDSRFRRQQQFRLDHLQHLVSGCIVVSSSCSGRMHF
eukprot:scaffold3537_cov256-Pinguiococcus_pyrenoidosus.AAC.6